MGQKELHRIEASLFNTLIMLGLIFGNVWSHRPKPSLSRSFLEI